MKRNSSRSRIAGAPLEPVGERAEGGLKIHYKAIHQNVLIVYVESFVDWKAYCVTVPGVDHADEAMTFWQKGTALRQSEAIALWPDLAEAFYRRGITWRL